MEASCHCFKTLYVPDLWSRKEFTFTYMSLGWICFAVFNELEYCKHRLTMQWLPASFRYKTAEHQEEGRGLPSLAKMSLNQMTPGHIISVTSYRISIACSCQPMGSANATFSRSWRCHPKTGFCYCKPGVAGPNCDRCLMGYWGFGENGCRPCDCARDCDQHTGNCFNG